MVVRAKSSEWQQGSNIWGNSRVNCIYGWIHRNRDRMHKTWASSSQKNSKHKRRGGHEVPTRAKQSLITDSFWVKKSSFKHPALVGWPCFSRKPHIQQCTCITNCIWWVWKQRTQSWLEIEQRVNLGWKGGVSVLKTSRMKISNLMKMKRNKQELHKLSILTLLVYNSNVSEMMFENMQSLIWTLIKCLPLKRFLSWIHSSSCV